ncbi:helix-turn-helix domain-containing protein [Gracilibacillus dipsosauri]|uniref:helix-turn-helix domain-containing protein n=1 Tax=Gracilibacillus dipsosauri TaxID=178340 RepID=UPI0024093F29
MVVNINKLKGKMVENQLNVTLMAEKLGVDRSTMYRKLNNRGDYLTIREANLIVDILRLTSEEAMTIFFNKFVAPDATKKDWVIY